MPTFDLKNAVVKIVDGTTPTANELEIKLAGGTIDFTENRPREYTLDGGNLDLVKDADEEPIDVSMEASWEFIKAIAASGTPTLEEALDKTGEAASWATTGGECEPYCVDIYIEYDVACGTEQDERIILREFRYETLDHDPQAGTISCTGRCNATEAESTRLTL